MIKCIMFDFDGTLVDSNEIKREAFFTVSNHLTSSQKIMSESKKKLLDDAFGNSDGNAGKRTMKLIEENI